MKPGDIINKLRHLSSMWPTWGSILGIQYGLSTVKSDPHMHTRNKIKYYWVWLHNRTKQNAFHKQQFIFSRNLCFFHKICPQN